MSSMSDERVLLHESLHMSSGNCEWLTDDCFVFRGANGLTFYTLSTKRSAFLPFPESYSITTFTTGAVASTISNSVNSSAYGSSAVIAVALTGASTCINFYSFPRKQLISSIPCPKEVSFSALAISRDGRHLVATTSLAKPELQYFDVYTGQMIATSPCIDHVTRLSFNPFTSTEVFCHSARQAAIFTIHQPSSLQKPVLRQCNVTHETSSVVSLLSHCWLPDGRLLLGSRTGELFAVDVPSGASWCSLVPHNEHHAMTHAAAAAAAAAAAGAGAAAGAAGAAAGAPAAHAVGAAAAGGAAVSGSSAIGGGHTATGTNAAGASASGASALSDGTGTLARRRSGLAASGNALARSISTNRLEPLSSLASSSGAGAVASSSPGYHASATGAHAHAAAGSGAAGGAGSGATQTSSAATTAGVSASTTSTGTAASHHPAVLPPLQGAPTLSPDQIGILVDPSSSSSSSSAAGGGGAAASAAAPVVTEQMLDSLGLADPSPSVVFSPVDVSAPTTLNGEHDPAGPAHQRVIMRLACESLPVSNASIQDLSLRVDPANPTMSLAVTAAASSTAPTVSAAAAAAAAAASSTGALALSMILSKQHVIIGTDDGFLLWMSLTSNKIMYSQHVDNYAGIVLLAFSPSFTQLLTTTMRGHMRLLFVTDRGVGFDPWSGTLAPAAGAPNAAAAASGSSSSSSSATTTTTASNVPNKPPALQRATSSTGASSLTTSAQSIASSTTIEYVPSLHALSIGHFPIGIHPVTRHALSFGVVHVPTVDPSPSAQRSLIFGTDGVVYVWNHVQRSLLNTFTFRTGVSSACASTDGTYAVIGLTSGVVCVLDWASAVPRLVYAQRLHSGPVAHVEFCPDGDLFATMGPTKLFFVRASDFKVVGYVRHVEFINKRTVSGNEAASALREFEAQRARARDPKQSLSDAATSTVTTVLDLPLTFCWQALPPSEIELMGMRRVLISTTQGKLLSVRAPTAHHHAAKLRLEAAYLDPVITMLPTTALSLKSQPDRTAIVMSHADRVLRVWEPVPDRLNTLVCTGEWEGHLKPATYLAWPSNGHLLASSGPDGIILVRETHSLSVVASIPAHDYRLGGTCSLAFTPTGTHLISTGHEGGALVWDLSPLLFQLQNSRAAIAQSGTLLQACTTFPAQLAQSINPKVLQALPDVPEPSPNCASFLSQFASGEVGVAGSPTAAAASAAAAGQTAPATATTTQPTEASADGSSTAPSSASPGAYEELQKSLFSFHAHLTSVMQRHSSLPEADQFPMSELAIDLALRDRLLHEGQSEVAQVRRKILEENAGMELTCERIKKQCWDAMATRGCMFRSFKGDHELHNFAIRHVDARTQLRKRRIMHLRKLEVLEKRWRLSRTDDDMPGEFNVRQLSSDSSRYIFNADEESGSLSNSDLLHYAASAAHGGGGGGGLGSGGGGGGGGISSSSAAAGDSKGAPGGAGGASSGASGGNAAASSSSAESGSSGAGGGAGGSGAGSSEGGAAGNSNANSDGSSGTSSTSALGGGAAAASASAGPRAAVAGGGGGGKAAYAHARTGSVLPPLPDMSLTSLLYHPLDLITPMRKRVQIVLLSNKITSLQSAFNTIFNTFYDAKVREIEHIAEKSKRMAEIQEEMKLEVHTWRPELADDEKMDSFLEVRDDEIKAGRRRDVREERKEVLGDAELDMQERQRALQLMMNGTLETKRDLSLLEQELVREPWMNLPPETLTEEQKNELARFEKKVKLIEQEKETRRKTLQMELTKLKSDVQEIGKSFDAKMRHVMEQRVAVQREVYIYEWMMIRLRRALMLDVHEEQQLVQKQTMLDKWRLRKDKSGELLVQVRAEIEKQQGVVDVVLADSRGAERQMRKDMTDRGENYDQLMKAYRSKKVKSRQQQHGAQQQQQQQQLQQQHGGGGAHGAGHPHHHGHGSASNSLSGAPGGGPGGPAAGGGPGGGMNRRGSVYAHGRKKSALIGLNLVGWHDRGGSISNMMLMEGRVHATKRRSVAGIAEEDRDGASTSVFALNPYPDLPSELDVDRDVGPEFETSPTDVSIEAWSRFLERRRACSDKDAEAKRAQQRLTDLQKYEQQLQVVDVAIASTMRELVQEIQEVLREREQRAFDVEVMLRIQQGQVELEDGGQLVVSDLRSVHMIDRQLVERLNAQITAVGSDKLGLIREAIQTRTAIRSLEWKRRVATLECEDRRDVTRQLQVMRVTKTLQRWIALGGREGVQQQESKRLERKIEFVSSEERERSVERQLRMMKLKKRERLLRKENDKLREAVKELTFKVQERKAIHALKLDSEEQKEELEKRRLKAVVDRRKLVDLAQLQSEEILFLQRQVEMLRRRTFASFGPDRNAYQLEREQAVPTASDILRQARLLAQQQAGNDEQQLQLRLHQLQQLQQQAGGAGASASGSFSARLRSVPPAQGSSSSSGAGAGSSSGAGAGSSSGAGAGSSSGSRHSAR